MWCFGLLLALSPKIPFMGKLPGDFIFKRDNYSIYFPLATSIIISVILSLVLNFILQGEVVNTGLCLLHLIGGSPLHVSGMLLLIILYLVLVLK